MKSKYSVRMYELLKSYEFKSEFTINIDDLKHNLYTDKYDRFYDFKKRVLDFAINEIIKFTDIMVEYTVHTTHRLPISITFKIRLKDINEKVKMITNKTKGKTS